MQSEIFTICKYAESLDGRMVITEPFHFIFTENDDCILDEGYVAIRIRLEANVDSQREFVIRMIDPDGIIVNEAIVLSPFVSIQNEIGFRYFHTVLPITGIQLPKTGRYSFNLLNSDNLIQSIPFVVLKKTNEIQLSQNM